MHEKKLDERDQKLITLLSRNARTPVAELARQVDLSRTAVRHRLEKLEQQGTIQGYTLQLKEAQTSAIQAIASVTLKAGAVADLRLAVDHLLGVQQVWSVAGNVDAFILLQASSVETLYELINMIGKLACVDKLHSHIVLA